MASSSTSSARRAGALAVALVLLALTPIALALEPTLFEDFAQGWEKRWAYSKDKAKYAGRFISVEPPGYNDPAIQVCLCAVLAACGGAAHNVERARAMCPLTRMARSGAHTALRMMAQQAQSLSQAQAQNAFVVSSVCGPAPTSATGALSA